MAIRYDPKLLDEIRRTVKNYQTKRRRVLARGGEIIPDPAFVSSFLSDYTDRRTLLKDLRNLQRYSKRGAEEVLTFESGQRITRYQLLNLKRLVSTAKRNITIELKQAPDPKIAQPIQQGYYENLKLRYEYLKRPVLSLSPRQFKTYERIAHGEGDLSKRRQTFYDNFQVMLDNLSYGLPDDMTKRLRAAFEKLPFEKLEKLVTLDPYLSGVIDFYNVLTGGGRIPRYEEAIAEIIEYVNAL